jgi:peptide subunit release factor 1 (eRF1)
VIVKERLRELARLRPEGHKVLSLYLNLDPSEFPTPRDRSVELESLLDVAEGALRQDGLEHGEKEQLKRDVEEVRRYFAEDFDASGTRGVVVFSASGAGLFEVLRLPRPVPSSVMIDDSPFIEPLTTLPGADGYCVLLINRQVARILVGDSERMREITSFVDDVHRWHDQGGWSQARYQRGIVKETRDHIKHAADELFKRFKSATVQRLIIGTPDELRGEIESQLHSYLRDRIAGWIDIDIRSAPDRVAKEAAPVIEEDEKQREREWLDRLQSELGRNARAVSGVQETLRVLSEKRVEAILLQESFHADELELALESALDQSAEIVVVRHHPDLEALGSIAAVLRY